MNDEGYIEHVTTEVPVHKTINGTCSQTGAIAAMTIELKTVHEKTDNLNKAHQEFNKEFMDFKVYYQENHGKLEAIMAGIAATLNAEHEAKIEREKHSKALMTKLDKIETNVGTINTNVAKLQSDMTHMKQDIDDHDERISILEKVKHWVYAGVGVVTIIIVIATNWKDVVQFFIKTAK